MTPAELRTRNFISVKEAADILGVDERTARRGIDQGQIPAVKIGTKTLIPGPRFAALIDPQEPQTSAELIEAVDMSTPYAITAAVEILRGALRALEALSPPTSSEAGPSPRDRPAVDTALTH